jgi:cysteine desulfuration protein SufE
MTILEKRDALVETLSLLPDNDERFTYLIGAGRRYPAMDPKDRLDERLLPGCISRLWLLPEYRDGRCYFQMDADAQITKGIAAVVCHLYSGETPQDVIAQEIDFLADVGVTQLLSPNRRNGLSSLRKRIKAFAESCVTA